MELTEITTPLLVVDGGVQAAGVAEVTAVATPANLTHLDVAHFNAIDPHMRTITPGSTKILHKAKFMNSIFDPCNNETNRRYFYVLENGYETNTPYWGTFSCCFKNLICSNFVCRGTDHIKRVYFDRGEYDERDNAHCLHLVSGKPRAIRHGSRCVLCCMDVPDFYECWCGEQISIVPFDTCCCCIPNSANYLTNCFNLCGPRLGQPIFFISIVVGLAEGEAAAGQAALDSARREWEERVLRADR